MLYPKLTFTRIHTNDASYSISTSGNSTYLVVAQNHADQAIGASGTWIIYTAVNNLTASIVRISENTVNFHDIPHISFSAGYITIIRLWEVDWRIGYARLLP